MNETMVIHGDLFDVLPTLDADHFHACVTDPPYGIGFMGREWDTFKPEAMKETDKFRQVDRSRVNHPNPNLRNRTRSPALSPSQINYDQSTAGLRRFQAWTEAWAREVFRVLKPGAHLIVCGAPRSHHRMMSGLEDAGFEIRDCLAWIFGQGFPKSRNLGAGWGTALKPGHEPIALARKPFTTSTQACHEAHRTAGLNIDACRIDYGGKSLEDVRREAGSPGRGPGSQSDRVYDGGWPGDPDRMVSFHNLGRWPANVLLDEDAAERVDEQSGDCPSGGGERNSRTGLGLRGNRFQRQSVCDIQPSNGGASRFFYVAKPSKEERDLGLDDDHNKHPTVKPLALMRWLVRLVTPPGGSVLDPFGGSGTTAMACAAEGVDFVVLEREAEYIPLLEARIRAIAPLFTGLARGR